MFPFKTSKECCHHHCHHGTGKPEVDVVKTRRRVEDALRKNPYPEMLVRAAALLGVEVAFLPFRPYFGPDQVRCIWQVQVGRTYTDVVIGGRCQWEVLEPPYQREDGSWWVKVKTTSHSGYKHTSEHSLVDRGVVPYKEGDGTISLWNQTNHLLFTDDSRHLAQCHCCHPCCHHYCSPSK